MKINRKSEKPSNGICIGKGRRNELYGTEYYYSNGQRVFVDDIYGEDCTPEPQADGDIEDNR